MIIEVIKWGLVVALMGIVYLRGWSRGYSKGINAPISSAHFSRLTENKNG